MGISSALPHVASNEWTPATRRKSQAAVVAETRRFDSQQSNDARVPRRPRGAAAHQRRQREHQEDSRKERIRTISDTVLPSCSFRTISARTSAGRCRNNGSPSCVHHERERERYHRSL